MGCRVDQSPWQVSFSPPPDTLATTACCTGRSASMLSEYFRGGPAATRTEKGTHTWMRLKGGRAFCMGAASATRGAVVARPRTAAAVSKPAALASRLLISGKRMQKVRGERFGAGGGEGDSSGGLGGKYLLAASGSFRQHTTAL